MINPYYFRDRILITAFSITPDGHEINHINPNNTIKQSYSEIEKIYVIKILNEMTENFARLMNQYIYMKIKECFQRSLINKMNMIKY